MIKQTMKCDQDPRFFYHPTTHKTKCYHIQELVKQTWNEAAAYCHKLGAHLGTINSARERHLLQNSIKNDDPDNELLVYGHLLYLGLHREVSRAYTLIASCKTSPKYLSETVHAVLIAVPLFFLERSLKDHGKNSANLQ